MTHLGTSILQKITTKTEMQAFLQAIGIDIDKPLIIKPNWIAAIAGEYTEAKPLELLLSCVNGPKYIVESYTFWRTDLYTKESKDYFSSTEATLEAGKQHWEHFKKMDEWFLEYTHIAPLLEKYNAKYINITNEYWAGRCVSEQQIQQIVEEKYTPIHRKEFYSFIPTELFNMRGAQLLSFSHAKAYVIWQASLSTKNLFGFIPAPTRYPLYHSDDNTAVPKNVIDINKVYRSLFDCFFTVEGITNVLTEYHDTDNNHKIVKDWGYMVGGRNSIEVDNIAAKLINCDLGKAVINPIQEAEKIFGGFDRSILEKLPTEAFVDVSKAV